MGIGSAARSTDSPPSSSGTGSAKTGLRTSKNASKTPLQAVRAAARRTASTPTAPAGRAARSTPTGPGPAQQPRSHQELLEAFSAQLAEHDPTGALVARSDNVHELARHAARRILDSTSTWVEHLGAFYDTDGVQHLLSRTDTPISRQAVHKRRGLLALTTGSGQIVYPAFQFAGRSPAPGLAEVLEVLPETLVSRWTLASWLVSPEVELDGERPIDVLHDQGPEGQLAVLDAARRWAAQLAA